MYNIFKHTLQIGNFRIKSISIKPTYIYGHSYDKL